MRKFLEGFGFPAVPIPPPEALGIENPEMRWPDARFKMKQTEHVRLVLFVAEQVTGSLEEEPPVQEITVAPMISRSLAGSVIALDHVAVPAGTLIRSPELALFTQSCTSVRSALAAAQVGLDPLHAANASPPIWTWQSQRARRPRTRRADRIFIAFLLFRVPRSSR